MIFMNFLSRNSRATGPKMRVPRGLCSLSMITMALLSKRNTSHRSGESAGGPHDDRVHHVTLLTVPSGAASLMCA